MTRPDSTTPNQPSGRQRLAQMRIISFAFIAIIPLLAVVTFVVVPAENIFAAPDVLSLVMPIAAGVLAAFGVMLVGNRVTPLPPETDLATAQRLGMARFQASFFLRLAFAEAPALVGLAAVFASGHESGIPFFIGGAIALLLHLVFAVPSASTVARIERGLDAQGARSRLSAAFGVDTGRGPTAEDDYTGGAILH